MRGIRFIALMLLFTFMVAFSSVSADDNLDAAWPIDVKCIPDPVSPPDNWTYPGTILMSGYAGIHGIQADWATPRVIAFFRKEAISDYPLYGGQLSPNGNWYALPFGETWTEVSYNIYTSVKGVHIYSMSGGGDNISFELKDYYDLYRYYPVAWNFLTIEWENDTSFMMGELSFHLPNHTVDAASYETQTYVPAYFSPDTTRFYGQTMVDGFGHTTTYTSLKTTNFDYVTGLAKLDDRNAGVLDLGEIYGVSWRRDSGGFVAVVKSDNQLVLFDRDGKRLESVFNLGNEGVGFYRGASGRNDLNWSPDNKQLAFSYSSQYSEPTRLYMVNLDGENVTDTCLRPITQPVWSPDGKMLAYLALARENLKIVVVDTVDWKAYDIGRMSGSYALSGSPEMVGWRE